MAGTWVYVRKENGDGQALSRARWCDSVLCRLRGLTFRRPLDEREGLILVEPVESRMGTSIHMFGVFFPLGVVWINSQGMVVDTCIARPWRLYFPKAPARFVLEASPDLIDHVQPGDFLEFVDEESA